MAEIYKYEELYEQLKDGKEVIPVSREEALMMALINKLGSVGADEGTTEKLDDILDRVMTISANSEERSLKKLLDYTKSAYGLIYQVTDIIDLSGYIEFSDTSNVTNMFTMFQGCVNLKTIPLFDTSNVTDMTFMFRRCKNLETIPLFDTINVTTMEGMFDNCIALTEVPLLDTSNVTNMIETFYECNKLSEVPLFDTSNVTNMKYTFYKCSAISEVPLLDTSNVTNMYFTFGVCSKLETIPLLDTSNVTDMGYMFSQCANLKEIPELDVRKVTNFTSIFSSCYKLESCMMKNIKANLQVGSGTSWGHLLTVDSLLHLCKELINVGSSRTLTVGTANLEKLAGIYVKTIDITDEMRAEDDLIDEKLPFEICESTDDGATLITEYVKLKKWQIK